MDRNSFMITAQVQSSFGFQAKSSDQAKECFGLTEVAIPYGAGVGGTPLEKAPWHIQPPHSNYKERTNCSCMLKLAAQTIEMVLSGWAVGLIHASPRCGAQRN
eukprot:1263353-Amphidinium_carterae.1